MSHTCTLERYLYRTDADGGQTWICRCGRTWTEWAS